MTRVWLASYPKSGNTWMRLLIGALALPPGARFELNASIHRGGIASSRRRFEDVTLLDSGLLTFEEIDRLRPAVHRAPLRDEDDEEESGVLRGISFVKVHDAYLDNGEGEPLLGGREACARAIVIVRDPRDIACSMANTNRSSIDRAIARMADAVGPIADARDRQREQLRQRQSSWSGHVLSWLEQRDVEVCVVRYEDMLRDTAGALRRAMAFAGLEISAGDAARAAAMTAFSTIRADEAENGFFERKSGVDAFFRRGRAGGWREELTGEQVQQLESTHAAVMERLGYALACNR